MANIGYAVFGSPKGLTVQSNGLFKELNIDKSLYLNNSHVVLDKGEKAIMIRRIPSSAQNLNKKDALLIVLYEHALQFGENRPGAFVGSAICFKEKMVNPEKIISGLFYLFSQIKTQVDQDGRFKAIDSSNWNISLPDSQKDFGMFEKSKLYFSPFEAKTKNVVVKLTNFEKDTASLLSHFCLNFSFHAVEYLYASDSAKTISKFTANGFHQIDFSALVNYTKHIQYHLNKLKKETEVLNQRLDKEKEQLASKRKKEIFDLDGEYSDKQNKLDKINDRIYKERVQLETVENEKTKSERDLNEIKRLLDSYKKNPIPKQSSTKSASNKNDLKYKKIKDEKEGLESRIDTILKRSIIICATLTLLLLTFLGLFIWKTYESSNLSDNLQKLESKNKTEILKKEKQEKENKELLENLKKHEVGGSNPDHNKFKKYSDILLQTHLDKKYPIGSELQNYINNHNWQFWEFDYTNEDYTSLLSPKSRTSYFITIDSIEIKKEKYNWKGEGKKEELLKKYQENPNNIYTKIDPKVLEDDFIMMKHFKWMIEKENKPYKELKKGDPIDLPFFTKIK